MDDATRTGEGGSVEVASFSWNKSKSSYRFEVSPLTNAGRRCPPGHTCPRRLDNHGVPLDNNGGQPRTTHRPSSGKTRCPNGCPPLSVSPATVVHGVVHGQTGLRHSTRSPLSSLRDTMPSRCSLPS